MSITTEQNYDETLDTIVSGTASPAIVSYADNIKNTTFTKIPLSDIIEMMRSDAVLQAHITEIRSCPDTKKRSGLKAQLLPYFNMATFRGNKRANDYFERTQHFIFDIDHIGIDQAIELKQRLQGVPDIYAAWISPGGDGVKFVCRLDREISNEAEYTAVYKYYIDRFDERLGIKCDRTSDAARACFVTYDPEIYLNEQAIPLMASIPTNGKAKKISKKDQILAALPGADTGNRTHSLTELIGLYRRQGFTLDFALEHAKLWNKQNIEPLPEDKLIYTVEDIYQRYNMTSDLIPYWSYGTDMLEIGIVDNKFYMETNLEKKIYARVGAFTDEQKAEVYNHLVTEKHISHIARMNYLGDICAEQSYYQYIPEKAVIDVHCAAVPTDVVDNQFIEDYLEQTFGADKKVIKEWLAVYSYTNYRKLPFLILTGDRGCGKNTFAEMVAEIYPSLSTMWHGHEKNFNPEVEMKLLIADETVSDDEEQYRTLKKYSGQKESVVNQKYLKPYKVPNNMNVVILSNKRRPIHVESDEIPTTADNNQFFVYHFQPFTGDIDTEYREKLVARLGNYIRTELKQVFSGLDTAGKRYSISVPITDAERALFVNSISNVRYVAERYVQKMVERYAGGQDPAFVTYIKNGFVPSELFDGFSMEQGVKRSDAIKELVDIGYLKSAEMERKKIKGQRQYVYPITDKLSDHIKTQSQP
jgi:hypothetical protein